ncbi:glutaredoxin 1 [Trichuris trichiura]|uniref:Glutaredoxin-1 n=1 Tax=Trichuris trichiura TaxID=36087 RepID=A0A077ZAI5_TRITR|nr:glutaredoxin 1 [Trichuris trichiura]
MSDAMSFVKKLISSKKVVVFTKRSCPYCANVVKVLSFYDLPEDNFEVIDLEDRPDYDAIMGSLKELTGARTVPRVFINEKSIGGSTDLDKIHKSGELGRMLEDLGLTS